MDDVSTPDDGTPAVTPGPPAPAPEHPRPEIAEPQGTAVADEPEDPPPATGDEAVDEATAEVAASFGETLEVRLAAYERAHRTLQDRLADVEG
jgi:hypothetical protein